MTGQLLIPKPLTAEAFAPFGEVIETNPTHRTTMNDARFSRYNELCRVASHVDGDFNVGIVESKVASRLPYCVETIERHPVATQAFIPLMEFAFLVVVAEPESDPADPSILNAFITNGQQGINYQIGTWHMPLVALEAGQRFLVLDRADAVANCNVHELNEPAWLELEKPSQGRASTYS